MNFNEPIPFEDALRARGARAFIPSDMGAAELSSAQAAIEGRALMLARVVNAEFGDEVVRLSDRVAHGLESEDKARLLLKDLLARTGYRPAPGDEGTIKDLRSNARLRLILSTQSAMVFGYAQWRQRQTQAMLDLYPAQELYRQYPRKEPRDWPTRWREAGGEFYDGRMVAARNAHIWTAISAFGQPYEPFDYNSGMGTRLIGREQAERWGVVKPRQVIPPARRAFEDDIQAGAAGLGQDIVDVLVESLGAEWKLEDGVLTKANEQRIEQLRNSVLAAQTLYD